jgi:hypothetical protein
VPVQASHWPYKDVQAHADPQREHVEHIEKAFVFSDIPAVSEGEKSNLFPNLELYLPPNFGAANFALLRLTFPTGGSSLLYLHGSK